jgi:hypothetical protein
VLVVVAHELLGTKSYHSVREWPTIAPISPFVRHHVNMLGRYSFQLPELPGGLRPMRDTEAADDA